MADGRYLEKEDKLLYLSNGSTDFTTKFCTLTHIVHRDRVVGFTFKSGN